MRPALVSAFLLLAAVLAGCSSAPSPSPSATSSSSSASGTFAPSGFPAFVPPADAACPGHWHVTFAVYVPGAGGEPDLLDLSVPRLTSGRPYYDFGVAANMTVAAHLHQTGAERGEATVGPFQMHHEASDTCTGIGQALRAVDVDAGDGTLRARGAHSYAKQDGEWHATQDAPLRVLIQSKVNGTWVWHEADPAEALGYQPRDNESYVIAIGPFSDEALRSLAEALPPPESRVA